MSRLKFKIGLALYLLLLVDMTLRWFPHPNSPVNFVPFHSIVGDWQTGGREFTVNFLGNIVAFLPLGFGPAVLSRGRLPARSVTLAGLLFSLAIELCQLAGGYRVADVDDVILNTFGTYTGYRLASLAAVCLPDGRRLTGWDA